jgi:hypothetical protein
VVDFCGNEALQQVLVKLLFFSCAAPRTHPDLREALPWADPFHPITALPREFRSVELPQAQGSLKDHFQSELPNARITSCPKAPEASSV